MRTAAAAAIWLALSHVEAAAGEPPPWVFANVIYENCQASDPSRVVECNDYLRGVADALGFQSDWKACFVKADNQQLRLAFLLYASQHPDELNGPAVKMAQAALTIHFPCKQHP